MPKRKNPFGDVVPIQLKTHVNSKHIATPEQMQEVYRRTRERLFQTASKDVSNGHHKPHEQPCKLVCRSCKKAVFVSDWVCSHCQSRVCGRSCLRDCFVCEQSFCDLCSVLNYDQVDVRTFCFNCLSPPHLLH